MTKTDIGATSAPPISCLSKCKIQMYEYRGIGIHIELQFQYLFLYTLGDIKLCRTPQEWSLRTVHSSIGPVSPLTNVDTLQAASLNLLCQGFFNITVTWFSLFAGLEEVLYVHVLYVLLS